MDLQLFQRYALLMEATHPNLIPVPENRCILRCRQSKACRTPLYSWRRLKDYRNLASGLRNTTARGLCFDLGCQKRTDLAFTLSIFLPLILATISYLVFGGRTKSEDDSVWESEQGIAFRSDDGVLPQRDKKGELVYKPSSYTPWPVEEGASGDRIRIEVGPVSQPERRTFLFERQMRQPSEIVAVSLPRPMGIVFEEDRRSQKVLVSEILSGSPAYKRLQLAQVNSQMRSQALLEGDVLRACTCTNFVYPTTALFGAQAPKRTLVLYGADNCKWPEVMNALKRGDPSDGDVTLVVERQCA